MVESPGNNFYRKHRMSVKSGDGIVYPVFFPCSIQKNNSPKDHWTLQWKGLNLFFAGVFWSSKIARPLRGQDT